MESVRSRPAADLGVGAALASFLVRSPKTTGPALRCAWHAETRREEWRRARDHDRAWIRVCREGAALAIFARSVARWDAAARVAGGRRSGVRSRSRMPDRAR